ncbi:MAG: methionyl-tRNA formyltransferase, partial [Candidatus Neomarinimicrobiota bacterium]|nr:methionyl-tRNA formyltransferase [Candidatus Neomarinimicrobiota bacterium]
TGDGALALIEIQLEGKKRMAMELFLRGFPIEEGDVLG